MNIKKIVAPAILAAVAAIAPAPQAEACSRILYRGDSTLLIVGRSLDWKTPIPTNLYVYPRGITKQGSPAEKSPYDSVPSGGGAGQLPPADRTGYRARDPQ